MSTNEWNGKSHSEWRILLVSFPKRSDWINNEKIFTCLFSRLLLEKSDSFDNFGTPTTYMSVCLLVSWILICVCIFRGVQSSGKVSTLRSFVCTAIIDHFRWHILRLSFHMLFFWYWSSSLPRWKVLVKVYDSMSYLDGNWSVILKYSTTKTSHGKENNIVHLWFRFGKQQLLKFSSRSVLVLVRWLPMPQLIHLITITTSKRRVVWLVIWIARWIEY